MNFAVAMAVPQLSRRYGNARLLAVGLTCSVVGMAWLSRVSADASYVIGIALPMMLVGAGQGLALSPLTAFGVTGVAPRDAGAASGVVNVAHQMGNSLGLAVHVALAEIGTAGLGGRELLAHRVSISLTSGTIMLTLALLLVLALIVRPRKIVEAVLDAVEPAIAPVVAQDCRASDNMARMA